MVVKRAPHDEPLLREQPGQTSSPSNGSAKEDSKEHAKEDAKTIADSPVVQQENSSKRRRSLRNTDRITLPKSTLQFRRLKELFFDEDVVLPDKTKDASYLATTRQGVSLQRVYSSPNIYVIDNFLSEADLAFFDTRIQHSRFDRSFCDKAAQGSAAASIYDGQHRTSTFVSFQKQENARVASIERRAAELLGCWSSECVEPLQLVRYAAMEFFGVHHDMGDLAEDGSVAVPPRSPFSKRRLVTLFCYLNDLDAETQGGATRFPKANSLAVQPKRGRAVLFCNVTEGGLADDRTIHEGRPVVEGVKYGLNIWICED